MHFSFLADFCSARVGKSGEGSAAGGKKLCGRHELFLLLLLATPRNRQSQRSRLLTASQHTAYLFPSTSLTSPLAVAAG